MAKKSKYEATMIEARHQKLLKEKAAAEQQQTKDVEQEHLAKLLAEANAIAAEVAKLTEPEPASPESPYVTKAQEEAAKKIMTEVLHPGARKAYNIWFDMVNRYYHMDVIEYDGMNVLSIKTERLTVSQAVAMAKVQKLFTEKLILRKKGV